MGQKNLMIMIRLQVSITFLLNNFFFVFDNQRGLRPKQKQNYTLTALGIGIPILPAKKTMERRDGRD